MRADAGEIRNLLDLISIVILNEVQNIVVRGGGELEKKSGLV